MSGTALDVAIGVVFVFFLFSLFLATALEAIASVLKLRARALEIAIAEMIDDPDAPPLWSRLPAKGLFGLLPFNKGAAGATATSATGDTVLLADGTIDPDHAERLEGPTEAGSDIAPARPLRFADVFRHPLVAPGTCRPSYVPAADFATALLHTVRIEGTGTLAGDVAQGVAALPQGPLRQALTAMLVEAGGDWTRLRANVEAWFDNAMDRLSGTYKRFSQGATFLVALLLALYFQLDSIAVVERLQVDSAMRAALVQQASAAVEAGRNAPALTAASVGGSSADGRIASAAQVRDQLTDAASLAGLPRTRDAEGWLRYLIGILVTALAGMLGAPFWFGLLQKLVDLRGTGPKPARSPASNGSGDDPA